MNSLKRDLIKLGQECAVEITGDPDEAHYVTTTKKAFLAIRVALRMGKESNDELNRLRMNEANHCW